MHCPGLKAVRVITNHDTIIQNSVFFSQVTSYEIYFFLMDMKVGYKVKYFKYDLPILITEASSHLKREMAT